jgi:hypothetical protein
MEVINDENGVGQQPRGGDGLGVDRGRVDRHKPNRLPELRRAGLQPANDAGAGTALDLAEQALITGEINEAGVPRVGPHPPARLDAKRPPGPSAAGLVDAQHPDRLRLTRRCLGGLSHGRVRGRPGHPPPTSGLGH